MEACAASAIAERTRAWLAKRDFEMPFMATGRGRHRAGARGEFRRDAAERAVRGDASAKRRSTATGQAPGGLVAEWQIFIECRHFFRRVVPSNVVRGEIITLNPQRHRPQPAARWTPGPSRDLAPSSSVTRTQSRVSARSPRHPREPRRSSDRARGSGKGRSASGEGDPPRVRGADRHVRKEGSSSRFEHAVSG